MGVGVLSFCSLIPEREFRKEGTKQGAGAGAAAAWRQSDRPRVSDAALTSSTSERKNEALILFGWSRIVSTCTHPSKAAVVRPFRLSRSLLCSSVEYLPPSLFFVAGYKASDGHRPELRPGDFIEGGGGPIERANCAQ